MAKYTSKKQAEKDLQEARKKYAEAGKVLRKVSNDQLRGRATKAELEKAEKARAEALKKCEELRVVIENWY